MVTRYCVPDREGKSPFLEGSVGGGEGEGGYPSGATYAASPGGQQAGDFI